MGRKGKLAVFESSNISETEIATPTKIGVHAFDINSYLHEFFELILFLTTMDYIVHGRSERENWPFLKVAISPKPKYPHPPKLACMHVTSIPIRMNYLSRFEIFAKFES